MSVALALQHSQLRIERRRQALLGVLLLACLLSLLLDGITGPSALTLREWWQTLWQPGQADPIARTIVWDIRLPAALLAVLTGVALGVAGAEMQTILDNPLADAFTLGLAPAAACGAALAMVLGVSLPGLATVWLVPGNAFLFAMGTALLLDQQARRPGTDRQAVLLFGIALVFAFNALLSLVQFLASAEDLQGLVFWIMGGFGHASWTAVAVLAGALLLVLPWWWRARWMMTAFRLGEARARGLGVPVQRVRRQALLRVSLLAALAVAFTGTIGFIGLMAPPLAQRMVGDDQRYAIPASGLIGGVLLSLAALLSKNLMPGVMIPVGIITALLGVPAFLWLVLRRTGGVA
ncbi:FecCD family ABC transporter permease [Leeia aquatica]|uniref:FecCD family ABC transporter permease n=1 Tax=Leeia aquatica TaxID=2725557 RepID=UPI0019817BE9|nr:iron ABC transporter permease [Leeia aquatica]